MPDEQYYVMSSRRPPVPWTTTVKETWRVCGLLAGPLFLLQFLQWCVGGRVLPNFAVCRPEKLPIVPLKEIPRQIREELQSLEQVLHQLDFITLYATKREGIEYAFHSELVLLDRCGGVIGFVTWMKHAQMEFPKPKGIITFSSVNTAGQIWSTTRGTTIEGFGPADRHAQSVPSDIRAAEMLDIHRRWVDDQGESLQRFDVESLQTHCLSASQSFFDFLVAEGFYEPVSEEDWKRLSKVDRSKWLSDLS